MEEDEGEGGVEGEAGGLDERGRGLDREQEARVGFRDKSMELFVCITTTSGCVPQILYVLLIPDTPCSVMRNLFQPLRFHLLHRVVQDEVDQDGIDYHARVPPEDLASDELDAPDAASAQLDFPWVSALNGSELADVVV